MKVLVITPTPTHPTTQGNRVRVAQIAGALRDSGNIVELLYYAVDGSDDESLEAMRAAWDVLYLVTTGGFRARRSHPAYWGLDDWVSPSLVEAVRFLAATTRYDAVVVNYVWCSSLLDYFPLETVRIVDTHDAFGNRHELARSAGMSPHWFYTSEAEEGRGLDRAHIVLAIQAEEAAYFRKVTRTPVVTVEYAAPPNFLAPNRGERLTVGYLGSGNPWNVQSVELFDALAVRLMRALPDEMWPRMLLFGGITRAVGPLQMFQPVGLVDDVIDAYREIDLVVNPMVGGTGLKIKTVEALAFGRPVLSTKAGGAGLEAIHPDLLHDDIEAMTRRMVDLLAAPAQLTELTERMRDGYSVFHRDVTDRLLSLIAHIRQGGTAPAEPIVANVRIATPRTASARKRKAKASASG